MPAPIIYFSDMLAAFHRIAPNGRIINYGSSVVIRQPRGAKLTLWNNATYVIDPVTFDYLAELRDINFFIHEMEQLRTVAFFLEKFKNNLDFCQPDSKLTVKAKG